MDKMFQNLPQEPLDRRDVQIQQLLMLVSSLTCQVQKISGDNLKLVDVNKALAQQVTQLNSSVKAICASLTAAKIEVDDSALASPKPNGFLH